jgi:hypothetical protein
LVGRLCIATKSTSPFLNEAGNSTTLLSAIVAGAYLAAGHAADVEPVIVALLHVLVHAGVGHVVVVPAHSDSIQNSVLANQDVELARKPQSHG